MQGLMKFHQQLLKILRKQNVTDGRMDNVKTVYPPTNTVCGGYKNNFKPLKNKNSAEVDIAPAFGEITTACNVGQAKNGSWCLLEE